MWPFEQHKPTLWEKSVDTAWTGLPMFALGAVTMYFIDPVRGRRRRAVARDKLFSSVNHMGDGVCRTARYTRDRANGLVHEARASMSHDGADDWTICQRVRSAMGRAVSHPGSIRVDCSGGAVTLSGPVLAEDVPGLLATVGRVRGVREVRSQLEVHEDPGDIPGLQGQPRRRGSQNWDPLSRMLAGVGGAGLGAWALAKRDTISLLGGVAGLALAARAFSNKPARRLTGVGAGPRAVDVQKTITINAPIEQVFEFFSSYENFPRFMRNVREVRPAERDTGRSCWTVAGPMGVPVTWEAELTEYIPGECICWCSEPGAMVENAGTIRFTRELRPDGPATRVDIKLSYNPPGGALGHIVARLFGADPKSEMDEDLARVKTTLETGHPPHDAAQPTERAHA